MAGSSFIDELKRRRVIKVAAFYAAIAWGVTEIVVTVADKLFLPDWVSSLAVIMFVAGFPVAMLLSWIFDITPDGIQRTAVSSRRGAASIVGAFSLLVVLTAALFVFINPTATDQEALGVMPNSIAVLPFENVGGNSEDDYMVVGLSDELRDQLGRVSGLRIAARSSSNSVREQALDAVTISKKLGVAALIEGSIRRRGSGLRISVQLIDGSSGLALWNATYDPGARELLLVQQSIAEQVVSRILPGTDFTLATQSTRSGTANEMMLLARFYEQQVRDSPEVNIQLLSEAIDLYRQATVADPESALAHARLAGALMYANDFAGAEAPIFRALSLDPGLSQVQNTLGKYYWLRGINGAGVAFKRAVELNPNNADALSDYAYWLWLQGHDEEPPILFAKALELDPLSLARFGALGNFYGHTNMVDETLAVARRVEEMFDDPAAFRLIARLMELSGKLDESIAWTIRARDKDPANPDHTDSIAELYAEIGDFDTALALRPEPGVGLLYKMRRYEELIDIGEFLMIEEPHDLELRYLLAYAYVVTGRSEAAVRVLQDTGLPETVLGEVRQGSDVEAFVTLIDALDAIGETTLATQLADWWTNRQHTENDNWWMQIYSACPLAVSGHYENALDRLVRAGDSARLPWESIIRDMHCLQRFVDEPRYQAMLDKVSRRRQMLKERLPDTLARHDVAL